MRTRLEILEKLRQQPEVAVLIVGGGVNGIGLFRDLALQGVDVLLVDKGDFCSGASAGSSHMIHGGLRYLENAEFRLVKEALTERNLLLQNAPHYVKPLPTTIPIFSWLSGTFNAPLKFLQLRDKPGERGALIIKVGLSLYDLFTRKQQGLPRHQFYSRAKSLEMRPKLNPAIVSTARYYDAWMPCPERICLEMILDAEAANPQAHALNYLGLTGGNGEVVTLQDEVSGDTFEIKPKIVVNAAGPWIDLANQTMQHPTKFIGGTKGSHIIIDHPELYAATLGHEMFFENSDGRIVLFFPFMDKVMAGTTDIRINDPEQARCTDDEVEYILNMVHKVFPDIKVDRSHIVFWFTGVRPLPYSDASRTSQISRDHATHITEPDAQTKFPVYSLVGGKWTTFRAFSEQTADLILPRLNKSRRMRTNQLAIGGGKNYPKTDADREAWLQDTSQNIKLPKDRLEQLLNRYGTRATEIAQFLVAGPDQALQYHPDYTRREIEFLAMHEKVVHLDDLLLRRSLIAMLGQANQALVEELAAILADCLGRSVASEIERATRILQDKHGVVLK
ncbi:MAG: glycerol-3-phosphate dehydrogenase/oxidase [Chloroflexi bacterium]|nr:glycerol-3-phosphate dehydrogenase/oxidase [Chloroflexota bacterium]